MPRWIALLFRLAVRAWPAGARARFGAEVEAGLQDAWRDEGSRRGRIGRTLVAVRLFANMLLSGVAFHRDARAASALWPRAGDGVALVLAVVGLYAVMSHAVAQRVREIGIRLALGADGGDVSRLVLGDGLRLAAAGLVAGGILAWTGSALAAHLVYSVSPRDPLTFALVALLLLGVSAAASYIPARRGGRIDPIVSLRLE
jgi:hypothetical protein